MLTASSNPSNWKHQKNGASSSANASFDSPESELVPLPTPTHFPFPYSPPYQIQVDFMSSLYTVIEARKQVAIFESPTGTGKSLSLLCGSLKWLKDNQQRLIDSKRKIASMESNNGDATHVEEDDDEPAWVRQQSKARKENQKLALIDEEIEKQNKRREYLKGLREAEKKKAAEGNADRAGTGKRQKVEVVGSAGDDFVLDEYESEEDEVKAAVKRILAEKDGEAEEEKDSFEDGEEPDEIKIFYCSRTHSQLSQVVSEIKKTIFGSSLLHTSLASRKNTCIHPLVSKFRSVARINDACLDLAKDKAGCGMLKGKNLGVFRDHAQASVKDIEELVEKGKELAICPYYGTRAAVRSSEIVTLPYPLLLSKSTRRSLSLSVKNHILIIDEAHNLIDAVTGMYSVSLSLSMIVQAQGQLERYFEKYKGRLGGGNVVYVQQMLGLLKALKGFAERQQTSEETKKGEGSGAIFKINDFVQGLRIDNINMFKIQNYLAQSRLAQKLQGFTEKQAETAKAKAAANPTKEPTDDADYVAKHVSALGEVERFVMCLTDADVDGRVLVTKTDPVELKYMLLNPAGAIRDLVEEARIVVLAGGTMEPVSDLLMQLFPYMPTTDIARFRCGHVIPPTSLNTLALSTGPSGLAMDFTYENRSNLKLIDELGQIVLNTAVVVPAGMVLFFVSYAYMETVMKRWVATEALKRLEKRKRIFLEPRDSGAVDAMLRDYAGHLEQVKREGGKGGAVLFAVVGGKMSEGINFADDLGRCVIMVGLPFPNSNSLELREKMAWLKSSRAIEAEGNAAASDYYENLCMRAVNQSIGRAIRHQNDYASILLVDRRYQSARIRNKISRWISDYMVNVSTFGEAFGKITQFFKERRTATPTTTW